MTTAPTELTYGYVDGRLILVIGDSNDTGRMPDPVPATGMTVQFTPKRPLIRVTGDDPTTVVKQAITCTLDEDGRLLDPAGERGVWLVTGVYTVTYKSTTAPIPSHDIEVTAAHTELSPLDLTLAMPPGGPILSPSQYAELTARIDTLEVGAVEWESIPGKPTAYPPTSHAASHSADGSDPITPADIGAATAAQGAKADSAVQPADVDDVIREGDARLTDARTPTSHEHSYADITDPPTIPGPQTLSLTGSDLSLSDGGGTVTLPAGGGGGGGIAFPYPPITAGVSSWWAGPNISGTVSGIAPGAAPLFPLVIGRPIRLTAFRFSVETAGEGVTHVALYGTAAGGTDFRGAPKIADLATGVDVSTTGVKTATGLAVDIPTPGLYWVAALHVGATQPRYAGATTTLSDWLIPHRASNRAGGMLGATGLSTLPATYPSSDTWDMGGNPLYMQFQTAVIP